MPYARRIARRVCSRNYAGIGHVVDWNLIRDRVIPSRKILFAQKCKQICYNAQHEKCSRLQLVANYGVCANEPLDNQACKTKT
jgi:hypothetical protein